MSPLTNLPWCILCAAKKTIRGERSMPIVSSPGRRGTWRSGRARIRRQELDASGREVGGHIEHRSIDREAGEVISEGSNVVICGDVVGGPNQLRLNGPPLAEVTVTARSWAENVGNPGRREKRRSDG